jgi:hypothetical protein
MGVKNKCFRAVTGLGYGVMRPSFPESDVKEESKRIDSFQRINAD